MDEIDLATERTESFTLMALQATLRRTGAEPSNGICRTCGMDIEPERLRVNPYAPHCCDCAAEEEDRSKRAKRCGPR